jgi:hypothetical protein
MHTKVTLVRRSKVSYLLELFSKFRFGLGEADERAVYGGVSTEESYDIKERVSAHMSGGGMKTHPSAEIYRMYEDKENIRRVKRWNSFVLLTIGHADTVANRLSRFYTAEVVLANMLCGYPEKALRRIPQ